MRLRWRWLYELPGAFLGWLLFPLIGASGLGAPIGLERPSNPDAHLRGVGDYGYSPQPLHFLNDGLLSDADPLVRYTCDCLLD